jgi:hypothetical protein
MSHERTKKVLLVGLVIAGLAAGGAAFAATTGGREEPLAGTALDRATRAALERTGGGTVIETDTGEGGAAYAVEVRLDDGRVIEVLLNERFAVIAEHVDEDGHSDRNESDEDGSQGS